MPFITLAIDGPVGAGKSTISDEVAKRLNILHLDTGAMYRAAGLAALRAKVDLQDEEQVSNLICADETCIDVTYEQGRQCTFLCGEDVSEAIRTQEAGMAASCVSRYPRVRAKMVSAQQEMAAKQSMLLDGRDIGTVVLPHAGVKIYLTASVQVRAKRRLEQLKQKGNTSVSLEEIMAEVEARDRQDMNRKTDPLRRAQDAAIVDSSEMDFEQTVQTILSLVEEKYGTEC